MAKKLDDIMATLPAQRSARIEGLAMKLATPKVGVQLNSWTGLCRKS